MDKIELFLTKQQRWMAWYMWKVSFVAFMFPSVRKFWKEEYDKCTMEVQHR